MMIRFNLNNKVVSTEIEINEFAKECILEQDSEIQSNFDVFIIDSRLIFCKNFPAIFLNSRDVLTLKGIKSIGFLQKYSKFLKNEPLAFCKKCLQNKSLLIYYLLSNEVKNKTEIYKYYYDLICSCQDFDAFFDIYLTFLEKEDK